MRCTGLRFFFAIMSRSRLNTSRGFFALFAENYRQPAKSFLAALDLPYRKSPLDRQFTRARDVPIDHEISDISCDRIARAKEIKIATNHLAIIRHVVRNFSSIVSYVNNGLILRRNVFIIIGLDFMTYLA